MTRIVYHKVVFVSVCRVEVEKKNFFKLSIKYSKRDKEKYEGGHSDLMKSKRLLVQDHPEQYANGTRTLYLEELSSRSMIQALIGIIGLSDLSN